MTILPNFTHRLQPDLSSANSRDSVGRMERTVVSSLRRAVAMSFLGGALGNPSSGFMRQRLISVRLPSDRVLGEMLAHPRSLEAVDSQSDAWWLHAIGEVQDRLGRIEHPYYRFADIAERAGHAVFFLALAACVGSFVFGATLDDHTHADLFMAGSALVAIALLGIGLVSHRLLDRWARHMGRRLERVAAALPNQMWDERDASVRR